MSSEYNQNMDKNIPTGEHEAWHRTMSRIIIMSVPESEYLIFLWCFVVVIVVSYFIIFVSLLQFYTIITIVAFCAFSTILFILCIVEEHLSS